MLMIISIKTYALALFEVVQYRSKVMDTYQELQRFLDLLHDNVILKGLSRSTSDYRVFDKVWKSLEDEFSPEVINFLRIYQEASLIDTLDRFIDEYRDLLVQNNYIHTVDITSATKLNEHDQKEIINEISNHYEGPLDIKYNIDPSIIGGVKVRINNDIYDTSIKYKFEQILKQGGLVHE